MDFVAVVDQVIALLRQRGRVTYRTLQRQFQLDDEALEDLKVELITGQRLAVDEEGTCSSGWGTRRRLSPLPPQPPCLPRRPRRRSSRGGTPPAHRAVL